VEDSDSKLWKLCRVLLSLCRFVRITWEQWFVYSSYSDRSVRHLVTVEFAPTAQPPRLDIKPGKKALKRFIPKVPSAASHRRVFAFC
jgi:hypothetical protein